MRAGRCRSANTGLAGMGVTEARTRVLDGLRLQIGRIERGSPRRGVGGTSLDFGIEAIDRVLPQGGLAAGALHEVLGQGADSEHATLPSLLVGSLLARHRGRGQVLWAMRGRDLFAPALSAFGLHPDRLILVEAGGAVLDVMEEALRHRGLLGVVGEIDGRLALTASRRLQLAAESSGAVGFAIRRSRRHDDPALIAPSAAASRWRVGVLPRPARAEGPARAQDVERVLGPALWQLELMRCRGAGARIAPMRWTLEACHETGRLSVAAALVDRPAASRPAGGSGRIEPVLRIA